MPARFEPFALPGADGADDVRLEEARVEPDLGRRAERFRAVADDPRAAPKVRRVARAEEARSHARRGDLVEMARAAGGLEIVDDLAGAALLEEMAAAYARAGRELERGYRYATRALEIVQDLQRPRGFDAKSWKRRVAIAEAAIHRTLGTALFRAGECPAALEELSGAAEVLADDVATLTSYGEALAGCGRERDALTALARAVAGEGPESFRAGELLDAVALRLAMKPYEVEALRRKEAASLAARVRPRAVRETVDEPALPLRATDGLGAPVAWRAGSPVVLLFWGAYSSPSVDALAVCGRLRNEGFEVVSVAVGGRAEDARRVAQESDPAVAVGHDPRGEDAAAFRVEGVPVALVLDAGGRVRYRNEGIGPGYFHRLRAQLEALGKAP